MRKPLILTALCTALSLPALAALELEPVSDNQKIDQHQTVNQNQGQVAVSLRYVPNPGQTQVFHPNGSGRLSDTFSPYAYRNIVDTQVFHLTIQNNEGQTLGADQLRVQVSLNGLPYEYLDRNALIKQWRHYYYLNTNTITGAPDFMEQERAIAAEHFIEKNSFSPQDVPPGGKLSGYLAVPSLDQPGLLKVRVRNLGNRVAPQEFVFHFNVKSPA
ncbi:MAG: hypothetical protein IGS03_17865 [Candidatus Sericytochromatia bacterium]|nr:hypothetical protein [Candidatus Sericytochromatia bacterium]